MQPPRLTFRPGLAALAVIPALAAAMLWLAPIAAAASSTFTVNSPGDGPDLAIGDGHCDSEAAVGGDQCTLRAAIQEANGTPDMDTIDFAIPGPGVHTIAPASALPPITQPVLLDGYSQHGASANTLPLAQGDNAKIRIELSGTDIATPGDGLKVEGNAVNFEIRGLAINRFGTGVDARVGGTVGGNFIGTDPTGMHALPNAFDGVFVDANGFFVNVGGPGAPFRNVISGNDGRAVSAGTRVMVMSNFIGTAADGRSPLGNRSTINAGAVALFGPDNVVGGDGEFANVIAFNKTAGIAVLNDEPPSVLSQNRIYDNKALAIDLDEDGRTPNDALDADTGPNGLQNFPDLTSARSSRRAAKIRGVLRSEPDSDYRVELFASPRRTKGAKRFLGDLSVTTNSKGQARFTKKVGRVAPGGSVSATATSLNGATSELSPPLRVKSR